MDLYGLNRRDFLRAAAGLGGTWLAAGCAPADDAAAGGEAAAAGDTAAAGSAGGAPAAGRAVGVQLYTVRDRMREDFEGTLQQVAAIGYREVEPHDYFGRTAEQVRAALDRAGLAAPAIHVPLDRLRDDLDGALADFQTVGHRWVVVPYLDEAQRTPEGYRRLAADLNRFGTAARDRGMRAGYHNHDFEFQPLAGGGTGMDLLLAETDPELVDLELDLFWAVKGGHQPVQMFEAHPGRFPLWHVKDMADIGGEERMVDVGAGDMDFRGIFAAADRAGLRHFFVEHDNPADPLASIRASYEHLRGIVS